MTARLHRGGSAVMPFVPLIIGRATTGIAVTCTLQNTWYALDIGTMLKHGSEGATDFLLPCPDWAATDIAGTDHKIEPRWPTGIIDGRVRINLYSAACGTSHSSAEDFTIGLFDVHSLVPSTGAPCLYAQALEDCPATQAGDTLELDFSTIVNRDADLRFYIKNRSAAGHDFEWDPIYIAFYMCD
jgi:hypothetical protein